jgi:ferredoxin
MTDHLLGRFGPYSCVQVRLRASDTVRARISHAGFVTTRCDKLNVLHRGVPSISPAFIRSAGSGPTGELGTSMKVWIDQDLCTGDGLCEEIAPDVFTLLDDGLAYVKEGDKVFSNPGGAEGLANIPEGQLDAVVESAEECPGECIFIEVE